MFTKYRMASGTKVGGMRDLKQKTPYLQTVDDPRATTGRGSTQPTLFGVIGRTHMDPYQTSLQDLVHNTKADAHIPDDLKMDSKIYHAGSTERGCVGPTPKTHIPGCHYGQVPYPGYYMSAVCKTAGKMPQH